MNVLTAEEMGAVDRRTAEEFGVPLESLMERAGNAGSGASRDPRGSRFGNSGGCFGWGYFHATHGPISIELDPHVLRAAAIDFSLNLFEPRPQGNDGRVIVCVH